MGAFFLVRMSQLALGRRGAWLLMSGALLIFAAGTLKAIWKLLYTIGWGNVRISSEAQFALWALGFPLLLASVVALTRGDRLAAGAGGQPTVLALAVCKIPFLTILSGVRLVISLSSNNILPSLVFKSPEIVLKSVDLPAPLAPITPTNSPLFTLKDRSFNTIIDPYPARIPSISNIYPSLPKYASITF